MRKILMLGVALTAMAAGAPAMAQSNETGHAAVGASAGGLTGGTLGFLVGGPVGAIIGGFTGAVLGADAAVSDTSIQYAGEHPVDPVYISGDVGLGYHVNDDVKIYPINGDQQYGYFYGNGRVWIVDRGDRKIVQSPGYAVRQSAVDYALKHQQPDASFSGKVTVGVQLGRDVALTDIPRADAYGYVYIHGHPVIVDRYNRTVVWAG